MFNAKVIQELIFRTRRDILIKVEIKDLKKVPLELYSVKHFMYRVYTRFYQLFDYLMKTVIFKVKYCECV